MAILNPKKKPSQNKPEKIAADVDATFKSNTKPNIDDNFFNENLGQKKKRKKNIVHYKRQTQNQLFLSTATEVNRETIERNERNETRSSFEEVEEELIRFSLRNTRKKEIFLVPNKNQLRRIKCV